MLRMRRLLFGLLLFVVFVGTLVSAAPARLLTSVLPADDIVLEGVSGTLWDGRASRAMVRLPAGFFHLGSVDWTLNGLSLLSLSPRLKVHSAWGAQTLDADIQMHRSGDFTLRDVDASVSADVLRQFAPIAVEGQFQLQVVALRIRDQLPFSGEGRLVWQDGQWLTPRGQMPLGTYALDFNQVAGEALRGEVVTLVGPVNAEGTVGLVGRSYDIDIFLHAQGGLDAQLKQALSLVASPVDGGYQLALKSDF